MGHRLHLYCKYLVLSFLSIRLRWSHIYLRTNCRLTRHQCEGTCDLIAIGHNISMRLAYVTCSDLIVAVTGVRFGVTFSSQCYQGMWTHHFVKCPHSEQFSNAYYTLPRRTRYCSWKHFQVGSIYFVTYFKFSKYISCIFFFIFWPYEPIQLVQI